MSSRVSAPGATRSCPHCKATILESANVCPVCRHHLRFDNKLAENLHPSFSALRVEGSVRPPENGAVWEYSMMLTIKNERGEEIARQQVGVGALQPSEQRTFVLSVDVYTPDNPEPSRAKRR